MTVSSNSEIGSFRASIVIPTFNRAPLLRRSIQSALDQTVPCEVIVVDHGSIDNTREVVELFGPRVIYLQRKLDSGPVLPWIDGLHATSSEFVKLLYDDDWLEPEFIETALQYFREDVGFVFTAASLVDASGHRIGTMFKGRFPESGVFYGRKSRRQIGPKLISPSALLMRREDMINGLFSGMLPFQSSRYHGAGPDHFVKLSVMLHYPAFGYSNLLLANFQAHPGSITSSAVVNPLTAQALALVYAETYAYYRFLNLMRLLGIRRFLQASVRFDMFQKRVSSKTQPLKRIVSLRVFRVSRFLSRYR